MTNLIRVKQSTAALSILLVFAGLSASLSNWFTTLAEIASQISMPIEIRPVCAGWYEKTMRGEYYFISAWLVLVFIYAVVVILKYAHKFTIKGERWFGISTLVNLQKVAALMIIQAPIIVLPMTIDPERMYRTFRKNDWGLPLSVSLSVLSFIVLSLLLYATIRRSTKNFKLIRKKILDEEKSSDTFTTEETIADLETQGPYYSVFCLQYTPEEYRHEERAVQRKILWILGMKWTQYAAVASANDGQIDNLACVRTATCSIVLLLTNLWYIRHLLRRPYVSHRPSSKMGDPINDAEILTTRTISLAAALLSLRDTLATDTASGKSSALWFTTNDWFMDLFCALVLILVVRANLFLFAGLDKDVRNALTRVLSTVRSSSMRESEPPGGQQHSNVREFPRDNRSTKRITS